MKIRRRDGTMVEVDDAYVLRDGEACVVGLPFMDSRRVHDSGGNVAGQRPGFLINDDARSEQSIRDAYKEYDRTLGERWRQGPGQPTAESKPQAAPLVFDSPQAAVAAAYADYDRQLTERWRRRW